MKTLTFAIFLFIALVASVFAQTDKPITEWIDLNLPDDEFAIQAPKGFEFEKTGYTDDKISARGEFHSDRDRFYIFIDPLKDPSQRKHVAAFLSFANQDTSKMELAPHVAARAQFEDTMGYFHRVVFVKTASRIFTLQTVSSVKNSENAVRFLNSFRLLPKAGLGGSPMQSGLEINRDSDTKLPVETDTQAPFRPFVGGGGMSSGDAGRGLGNESDSGSGSTLPSPTPSSPLRITFKLKAQYTDFARFYMVQGTVTLRVVFLASGGIGSIVKIKGLPFGLTETATFAARQMKFEPEVADGFARTTSRPVSFTFNIY
jgi:hypothetical protein